MRQRLPLLDTRGTRGRDRGNYTNDQTSQTCKFGPCRLATGCELQFTCLSTTDLSLRPSARIQLYDRTALSVYPYEHSRLHAGGARARTLSSHILTASQQYVSATRRIAGPPASLESLNSLALGLGVLCRVLLVLHQDGSAEAVAHEGHSRCLLYTSDAADE